MIWDPRFECMDREEMRALQLARLRETLARVYDRVPFYRESFDRAGVKPADLETLEDIRKFPFTVKTDLRDHYPYGLFAVPMKEVVRLHASSGTTGKPIVVGYTKNDLETWAECIARIVTMAGVTASDVAQVTFGYGLLEELEDKLRRKLYSVLSLSAKVRLLEPKSLERSTGKAKRVIDNRPKNGL